MVPFFSLARCPQLTVDRNELMSENGCEAKNEEEPNVTNRAGLSHG